MKAYSERLKENDNLGEVGGAEVFETKRSLKVKNQKFVELIKQARHVVCITGAGISTSCGIPDFRGPEGVWTQKLGGKKVEKLDDQWCFEAAIPSLTHMAIKKLVDCGKIRYLISQNVDNLHTKSGITMENFCEVHGNIMKEKCVVCKRIYTRSFDCGGMSFRPTGRLCECGGKLVDQILDWNDEIEENYLSVSTKQSKEADLLLCVGSSLRVQPVNFLPRTTAQNGGSVVIINLQKTDCDDIATLKINNYCDDVFRNLMKGLSLSIPAYIQDDIIILENRNRTFSCCGKDGYRCVFIETITFLICGKNRSEKILKDDDGINVFECIVPEDFEFVEISILLKNFVTCKGTINLGKFRASENFRNETKIRTVEKNYNSEEEAECIGGKRSRNEEEDDEDEYIQSIQPLIKKRKE